MASAFFRVIRFGSQLCQPAALWPCNVSIVRSCSSIPGVAERSTHVSKDNDIINKTDSAASLLNSALPQAMSTADAIVVVTALGKLVSSNKASPAHILSNDKFMSVCAVINDNIASVNNTSLIAVLRNVLSFGIAPTDPFVTSLEMQVLWKMRSMSLKHFVLLLNFHLNHQETDLQKKIVSDLLARVQQRWFEIATSTEVVTLIRHLSYFRSDFVGKLEDRVIDLVGKMSVEDLHRIFVALFEQKLRVTHLLRAVAFHISKHQQKLGVKQIASLVNAMNALSFVDVALLQRLSEDLLPEVSSIENPTIVAALLTAFGRLLWKNTAVLEAITRWIMMNLSKCRTTDLVAFILAIARVHHIPQDSDSVFASILPRLSQEAVGSDVVWVDVVWSLAILKQCTLEQAETVLSEMFCEKLNNFPGYQSVICRRKIWNVYGVAKLELAYKGRLSESLASDDNVLPQSASYQALRHSVLDTLSNYVPKGKFLSLKPITPFGVIVDAEFVLDKDGKPLPIDEYTTNFGEIPSKKVLPTGAHRIALLVCDYRDFTRHTVTLSGIFKLNRRILNETGYQVVEIPYLEYNSQDPTLKRLQYLQQKIYHEAGIARNEATEQ